MSALRCEIEAAKLGMADERKVCCPLLCLWRLLRVPRCVGSTSRRIGSAFTGTVSLWRDDVGLVNWRKKHDVCPRRDRQLVGILLRAFVQPNRLAPFVARDSAA